MISKKKFMIIFVLIVVISFFLRIYQLGAKPIHHDEAILEYYYVKPLLDNYALNYMGSEYHGLGYHYITYVFARIFGLSIFSIRLAAAVFGSLSVLLLYYFQDYLGRIGVLFSAAFLAVSTSHVYYSRQYTSYPFLIFFLLLSIIVASKYFREYKTTYIYWMFIILAILFNINETIFIFLFVAAAFAYLRYLFDKKSLSYLKKIKWRHFFLGLIVCVAVFIWIHTNFFIQLSNIEGLLKLGSDITTKTVSTGHNKSFPYYFTLIIPFEAGLLLISLIGLLFFKRKIFSYFLIFWSISFLFIFSMISYKTNWILPLVITPLILLAGDTMDHLTQITKWKYLVIIAGILLVLANLFFSIQQNFIYFNDLEKNKIGYVETSVEVEQLVSDIHQYVLGRNISILITAKGYWPLPVYLKDYYLDYDTEIEKLDLANHTNRDIFISEESQVPDSIESFTKKKYELRQNYYMFVLYRKIGE